MASGISPEEVIELKHAISGIAELSYTFFEELKGRGFTDKEALTLTSTWLSTILANAGGTQEY